VYILKWSQFFHSYAKQTNAYVKHLPRLMLFPWAINFTSLLSSRLFKEKLIQTWFNKQIYKQIYKKSMLYEIV